MKNYALLLLLAVAVSLGFAIPAAADSTTLSPTSIGTARDNGPQDGVFDVIEPIPQLGSVNNNGFTSLRTAFEYAISSIPAGSVINSATLTLVIFNPEGVRSLEIHGYTGDGAIQLSDFALNGLVASHSPSIGTHTEVFDVASFVSARVANGDSFAGFNVRENPANASNFQIMKVTSPVLSIDFLPPAIIVDIDVRPGSAANPINPRARGVIPVAILGSDTFDVADVDVTTLAFGPCGSESAAPTHAAGGHSVDANGDAFTDLLAHYRTGETGLASGDTEACVTGELLDGTPFEGSDNIRVIAPRGGP